MASRLKCLGKSGPRDYSVLWWKSFCCLEGSSSSRVTLIIKLLRFLTVKITISLIYTGKQVKVHEAMVSWFSGWRFDRCNENIPNRKIKVGKVVPMGPLFLLSRPTDYTKLGREKSAIQWIKWPRPSCCSFSPPLAKFYPHHCAPSVKKNYYKHRFVLMISHFED